MTDKYSRIKVKAKLLSQETKKIQTSESYRRVVGVLSGLGFLIAPGVQALPSSKVELEEALRIGKAIEPRILEVLPAAVLSFPKSFLHQEKSPQEFKDVVAALKNGKIGPNFEGISFQKFFEAANRVSKNRKRKIVTERKIPKTFRFSQTTIRAITERAKEQGIDHTSYIEKLIESDYAAT